MFSTFDLSPEELLARLNDCADPAMRARYERRLKDALYGDLNPIWGEASRDHNDEHRLTVGDVL